jgi:uncharacterized damage-inducible protein DinB
MSTATAPASTRTVPGPRQHLSETLEREHAKTMRVLRAHPKEKCELRPHARAKSARELAWMFALEQGAMQTAMTTGFDWSKPPQFPPAPESFEAVLAGIEQSHAKTMELVRRLTDEDLSKPVQFFTGPGQIGDVSLHDILWTMLSDEIHHRGQFSVYLRMADGKVPSIYGPSADEPWM